MTAKKTPGFTLLEALVVLALLAVLLTLAAPGMSGLRQQHQMQGQAEQLQASLMLARSQAVARQQRVTLCVQGAAQTCATQGSWAQGWLVFVDSNNSARRDPAEVIVERQDAMPEGFQLTVTNTVKSYFSYGGEGRSVSLSGAFMAGTWRFC